MTKTQVLQEARRMRFEEAYGGWQDRRLTQEEAARLLGGVTHVSALRGRYEEPGFDGLVDERTTPSSPRHRAYAVSSVHPRSSVS